MRWDDDPGPIVERGTSVTLDMLKVGVTRMLSQELVSRRDRAVGSFVRDSITIDAHAAEYLRGQLAVDLRAYVLAEKKDVHTDISRLLVLEVETPATPWHHFRHNHRDAWWLRWIRRPIRYTTHRKTGEMRVDMTRYLTYPHADVPYREFGPPVQAWMVTDHVVERDES